MKKRNSSKTSIVSNPNGSRRADDSNVVVTRNGLFMFSNGDKYEGEYIICGEPPYLLRQGRGVYDTDDFNKYEGVWDADKISDDPHIRYNNGTAYKGGLDAKGRMSGRGSYFLPDGSSIDAEWKENKLLRDIRYKEPLGFTWNGEISESAGNKVRFVAGNNFWDECLGKKKTESFRAREFGSFRTLDLNENPV